MRNVRLLVLGAAFSAVTSVATAGPLTISNVTGTWIDPAGPAAPNPTIVDAPGQGTDTVRWGTDTGSGRSGYDFTPIAGAVTPTLATPFKIGTWIHHNNPILDDGNIPTSINYDYGFDTNGAPPSVADTALYFHNETPNNGPCAEGAPPCPDIVDIVTSLNVVITVGSDTYFFNILGFSQDGGVTTSTHYVSPEGGSNTADLYAIVTSNPIPEPTSMLLFGTGLATVASRLRRRKK